MTDPDDSTEITDYLTASRRLRPCFKAIDMRGRVTAPCTRYLINDRVHFLDDASFKIFEEGLKRHRGVLTMETFEAIVGAPETPGSDDYRQVDRPMAADSLPPTVSEVDAVEIDQPGPADQPAVESLPFGFFAQRREPRVQYVCEIQLNAGGQQARGVTFDLSVNGARISIQGDISVDVGAIVALSFMGLTAQARGIDVYDVPYQVVRKDVTEEAVLLGLRRIDARRFAPFANFLGAVIARHDSRRRPDAEDDFKTALVWYYERLIAQYSAQIPFFIAADEAGGMYVDAIAASPGNQHLLRFFSTSEDNYNFTPLCLPERLQTLAAGEPLLLAMYRERGEGDRSARIHSASDRDYESAGHFADFIAHARSHAEHCLLLAVAGDEAMLRPYAAKIELYTQRLRALDGARVAQLRARLQRLQRVAILFDMTALLADDTRAIASAEAPLAAWVGTELRDLRQESVSRQLELSERALRPELIRFGYVERRREERYLARTAVRLQLRETALDGMTVDISMHGLRVLLSASVDVKRGMPVAVGLPSMQKKRGSLDLMTIPYRIVGVQSQEDGTLLMLERAGGVQDSVLDDFFAELIRKNRYKLQVDTDDSASAAIAGVYESMFALNLPSTAFFIGRDPRKGICLQFTGVAPGLSGAAGDSEDGRSQLAELLNEEMVKAVYDAVQMQGRREQARAPFEFLLYHLPAGSGEEGAGEPRVVSDFDFDSAPARAAFLNELAGEPRWRVVRVSAAAPGLVEDSLFGQLLEGVRAKAKHRAIRLSDIVSNVVACGELFDITDAFRSLLRRQQ